MKVLLTGSTGLVGTNIVEQVPENVILLTPSLDELDLLNPEHAGRYLQAEAPDLIIHAAGTVGGIQANIEHPVRFLTENTLMGHNLIMAAFHHKIKHLINLGSSCMYPKEATNPLKEEYILKGKLEPTNEGYALAKIYCQRLCYYINRETKTNNFKTLVPCNLFGRWDKFDPKWGHMIPSVIRKLHEAKSVNADKVSIWGDGSARREFMFASDFADFIWFAVDHIEQIPELINVGIGFDYSILEYYKAISEVIGYQGSFEFDLSKPTGMKQKLVDISVLKNLGWSPKHTLLNGIEITYKFYNEHYS